MKEKDRILLVHNFYQLAGGEDSVLRNEKEMLERHGHFVMLYTRSNDELRSLSGKMKYFFSFLYSRRSYKKIKELIIQNHINIVHVHNTFPLITGAVYQAAHDAGVPVVQTLHNFRFVCPGALYMRDGEICEACNQDGLCTAIKHGCYRKSKMQTALSVMALLYNRRKKLYEKINAYIALTEFNKQKFESEFPWCRNKIYVKPNYVTMTQEQQEEYTESEGYIFVGRLSEEKGIRVLLETFLGLPGQTLTVVGSGPMEQYVHEFVEHHHLQNIKILGQLPADETMNRLTRSKALIAPSICYEGFPMTIVEAFACGVPVIGSNKGNVSVVIDDLKNGALFRMGDAEDLRAKILFFESNPMHVKSLRDGARKTYLQYYICFRLVLLDPYLKILLSNQ